MSFRHLLAVLFTSLLFLFTGAVQADEIITNPGSTTQVVGTPSNTTQVTTEPGTTTQVTTQPGSTTQVTTAPGTTTQVTTVPDGSTPTVIVTPTPAAKEVIATPQGYVKCYTVDAGWYQNLWVPAHKVCEYQNTTEGVAWVEGYWACNKHTQGECTNWEWRPGHWVKTLMNY